MNAARKRSKGPPLWSGALLLVVSVGFSLIVAWPRLGARLRTEERTGGSQGNLILVGRAADFETLAYVRRTVFPHDYYHDDTTYNQLLMLDEDALTPDQDTHLRAASLAWDLELALSRSENRFVVVTTVLTFGYDLEELEIESAEERVLVSLPPADLLTVTVEDIDRAGYPYGEVPVDAEEWRLVTTFVRERIESDPVNEELRAIARRNAIDILETLFLTQSRTVEFVP